MNKLSKLINKLNNNIWRGSYELDNKSNIINYIEINNVEYGYIEYSDQHYQNYYLKYNDIYYSIDNSAVSNKMTEKDYNNLLDKYKNNNLIKSIKYDYAFILPCSYIRNAGHAVANILTGIYIYNKFNLDCDIIISDKLFKMGNFISSLINYLIPKDKIIIIDANTRVKINRCLVWQGVDTIQKNQESVIFLNNWILNYIKDNNISFSNYDKISIFKIDESLNMTEGSKNNSFSNDYKLLFENNDFKCLFPENYDIIELFYYLNNAKEIALSWGCNSYLNKIFINDKSIVYLLCHEGYKSQYDLVLKTDLVNPERAVRCNGKWIYEWLPKCNNEYTFLDLKSELDIENDTIARLTSLISIKNIKKLNLKFCICFWGCISRSLKYTIKSIENNIFNELKKYNIEFDVYVHNMKTEIIKSYNNNVKIEQDFKLLPFNYKKETIQKDFDKTIDWEKYSKNGIMPSGFDCYQNSIRQLFSVNEVTNLWEKSSKNYDYYLYLRPDLIILNKLDVEQILKYINKDVLLTPYWGKWGGLNDRIYFGNKHVIKCVGNRFINLDEYNNTINSWFHPESFLKFIVHKQNINIVNINLKGSRVRSNGEVKDKNFHFHIR